MTTGKRAKAFLWGALALTLLTQIAGYALITFLTTLGEVND